MHPGIRGSDGRPKSLVLAVAAHVEDGGPRPAELDWWLFRDWGQPYPTGWQEWPLREFTRARAARNVYVAMTGYKEARDVVTWCNSNPAAWELVSGVMSMRMKANNGA